MLTLGSEAYNQKQQTNSQLTVTKRAEEMSIEIIKKEIRKEIKREKKLLDFLEARKKQTAKGSLTVKNTETDRYCYQTIYENGERYQIYLDKDNDENRIIIKELMENKTLVHATPILRRNISAMEMCVPDLAVYSPLNYKYGEYLGRDYYLDDDVCFSDWISKPDCQNPFRPQDRIHETKSGKMVRSKSEVLIADTLYDLAIHFKYEAALTINNKIRYPDFELFHPTEKRLIWWEHLGKTDDVDYVYRNIDRLSDYGKEGIRMGDNLIVTCETKEIPLTHREVNKELSFFGML